MRALGKRSYFVCNVNVIKLEFLCLIALPLSCLTGPATKNSAPLRIWRRSERRLFMKSPQLVVCTAVAFLFLLSSCTKSEIVAPTGYTDPAGDPIHSPGTGVIADPSIPVKITTTSPLANIYYTLDGTTPSSQNGFLYSNVITLGLSSGSPNRTLKSIALVSGWTDSAVITSSYSLVTPVGKWLLNENTGTTTADSSGSGYNGTLTGNCAWVTGQSGAAVTFGQGPVGYINCGAASGLNLSDNITICAWINSSSVTNTYEICGKYSYTNNGYQFNLTSSRVLNFGIYKIDTSASFSSTGTVPTGWNHVAVTLKSRVVSFYINGVLSGTSTFAWDMIPPTSASFIISHSYAPGCFIGAIDNLRVYNTVLDSANIASLYTLGL